MADARADFAEQITQRLREVGDSREINYDGEKFCLVFTQGDRPDGVLNLTNLFAEYSELDEEYKEARISEIVRAALSHLKPIPEDFSDASHDLRPRLWARATYELMQLKVQLDEGVTPQWPIEAVGSHLFMSFVFDFPESVRSVSESELEEWGVSFWQAREAAMENLAQTPYVFATLGDELYVSNTGDSYDATRLMLTNLIEQVEVEGLPIAMAVNRNTLLITGSKSQVGLKMMAELAIQELNESPRPLSAIPLIYRDGAWEDWEFPTDHESYPAFKNCQIGWHQSQYAVQHDLLTRLNEAQSKDEFVATYTVSESEGNYFSYSVWGQGVVASLPRTDLIALIGEDHGEPALVNWEQVVSVCGDLMEEVEIYPPRFLVKEFPTAEQISAM